MDHFVAIQCNTIGGAVTVSSPYSNITCQSISEIKIFNQKMRTYSTNEYVPKVKAAAGCKQAAKIVLLEGLEF